MSNTRINRRDALKLAGVTGVGIAGGVLGTTALQRSAHQSVSSPAEANSRPSPSFFTEQEREMVKVLVDDILTRDERSGSATEAGVPEFMENILMDEEVTPPLTQL